MAQHNIQVHICTKGQRPLAEDINVFGQRTQMVWKRSKEPIYVHCKRPSLTKSGSLWHQLSQSTLWFFPGVSTTTHTLLQVTSAGQVMSFLFFEYLTFSVIIHRRGLNWVQTQHEGSAALWFSNLICSQDSMAVVPPPNTHTVKKTMSSVVVNIIWRAYVAVSRMAKANAIAPRKPAERDPETTQPDTMS